MNRRDFVQNAVAGALVSATGNAQAAPSASKMIGIQVGAVSFADEGVGKVLDECQKSAAVDTLFVATFTYGRGIAGRQVPGQPLPDHGSQKYDTDTFFGGAYTKVNAKYYGDTAFKSFRAPDLGDYDVLEKVIPEAKKRGMKTICWYEDVFRRDLEGELGRAVVGYGDAGPVAAEGHRPARGVLGEDRVGARVVGGERRAGGGRRGERCRHRRHRRGYEHARGLEQCVHDRTHRVTRGAVSGARGRSSVRTKGMWNAEEPVPWGTGSSCYVAIR